MYMYMQVECMHIAHAYRYVYRYPCAMFIHSCMHATLQVREQIGRNACMNSRMKNACKCIHMVRLYMSMHICT